MSLQEVRGGGGCEDNREKAVAIREFYYIFFIKICILFDHSIKSSCPSNSGAILSGGAQDSIFPQLH